MILDILQKACQENLEIVILLLFMFGFLNVSNIVLGTVIGTFENGFNIKKFLFGVEKWVVTSFGILLFAYVLNIIGLTIKELGAEFSLSVFSATLNVGDMISIAQVIGILITWCFDLIKEVIDKMKKIKELKYLTYDDVEIQQNASQQEGKG